MSGGSGYIGSIQPGGMHELPSTTATHATRLASAEAALEMARRRIGRWSPSYAATAAEIHGNSAENMMQTSVSERLELLEFRVLQIVNELEQIDERLDRLEAEVW